MVPSPSPQERFATVLATIRARFPHLQIETTPENPREDAHATLPAQPGLSFAIDLSLQGDELHIVAGSFWVEWFPCHNDRKYSRYLDSVLGLLSGEYRIVETYRGQRPVRATLERPVTGGWARVAIWGNLGALVPWGRTTRILSNSAAT
jgi:hypothetical protein